MTLPKLHVAVLMGGWSNERPVSLMSGEGVAKALEERGHRVTRIDMGHDVAARLAETAPTVCTWVMNSMMPDMMNSMKSARMGELRTPITR